ncbi:MAG: hypothetical protein PHQ40_19175 [Anaerolineaceae bacterium]|nr:hypothetical protein [Anaerolineaceae bacterium]
MNKLVLSIVAVGVVALVFGTAGFVYAQSSTPPTPVPGSGYGYGMMGGRGARGGMMGQNSASGTQDGLLHDAMVAVFAEKLGISVDDLNRRLANGETMFQVAASQGLTADQFRTLMTDARNQAIDQAMKAGNLTQAQADWMKQHSAGQMMGNGRGMHASGFGQNANPGCPYLPQTQS